MKTTTIPALLIARTLFERAAQLCHSEDSALASAGLVIVQDALEMVFYTLLIELGVDEQKALEGKSFKELIGELRLAGVNVPKSGTLKALNQQRVLSKHYAQVAEPKTVRNYFETAEQAIDAVIKQVTGRSIRELFMTDFLKDGEAKTFLKSAEVLIEQQKYLEALIEIRKAIFIEFESPFSISDWRDYTYGDQGKTGLMSLGLLVRGGWRAPSWTRNKEWIEKNVLDPTGYVQLDHDEWRLQATEYGIHTGELQNLRRLTPDVFRANAKSKWCIRYDADFPPNDATEANAKYCLDRAIAIILKRQEHGEVARDRSKGAPFDPPPIYIGQNVYTKASSDSGIVHTVADGFTYEVKEIVSGFDPSERFFKIVAQSDAKDEHDFPKDWFSGYLLLQPQEE